MKNFKILGFVTGAILAGGAVIAVNAWRSTSDDDLLTSILHDHCVPYVTTQAEPFTDMGRTPGVYDEVPQRPGVTGGGVRVILDSRFLAWWGTIESVGRTSRICAVQPVTGEPDAVLHVAQDGFVARYSDLLSLTPQDNGLSEEPGSFAWYEDPDVRNEGLRVVMIVYPGIVASIVVMDDVDS